jgi:hypothetical protein
MIDFGYRSTHEMTLKGQSAREGLLRRQRRSIPTSKAAPPAAAWRSWKRNDIPTTRTESSPALLPTVTFTCGLPALREASSSHVIRKEV